ncbi:MAG: ImmA/IrrE family metallo-endopeptidase [Acetobacteraceae bacterium]
MTGLTPAERLLRSLGVSSPAEIDLEAIAFHLGVLRIKYRPLDGCDARIVGVGERAIITVDNRQQLARQRFSVAHEIGHWHHHRGRTLFCGAADLAEHSRAQGFEQTANRFASNLLLPGYLLDAIARGIPRLTLKAIRETASAFGTSLTATAIRLAEVGHCPAMLICHGVGGRKWFVRSPGVPDRWFPQEQLDGESYAFDLLHGHRGEQTSPRKIGADAWFNRHEAQRYDVQEQSVLVGPGEILTVLNFTDGDMLEEEDLVRRWR